ncbi:hypothetical protein JXB31_00865 [Candidatus Woesearchaeota archaeon]|nr:hypothetical protein [Candidatus Woesearchaeota archaeon]
MNDLLDETTEVHARKMQDKKDNEKAAGMLNDEIVAAIRETSRRLRVLEERYSGVRKNIQLNEQNMLSESKKNATEIKTINVDMVEIKKSIRSIGEELKQIIKELKLTVKKEEFKVMERYLNLWQPMDYVSHTEMENRIKDIVKQELTKKGIQ